MLAGYLFEDISSKIDFVVKCITESTAYFFFDIIRNFIFKPLIGNKIFCLEKILFSNSDLKSDF